MMNFNVAVIVLLVVLILLSIYLIGLKEKTHETELKLIEVTKENIILALEIKKLLEPVNSLKTKDESLEV